MIKNSVSGLILGSILQVSGIVQGGVLPEAKNPIEISKAFSNSNTKSRKRNERNESESLNDAIRLIQALVNEEISIEDVQDRLLQIVDQGHKLVVKAINDFDYNSLTIEETKALLKSLEMPFTGWKLIYENADKRPANTIEKKLLTIIDDIYIRLDEFVSHLKILSNPEERPHFLAFYNGTYESDGDDQIEYDCTEMSSKELNKEWI